MADLLLVSLEPSSWSIAIAGIWKAALRVRGPGSGVVVARKCRTQSSRVARLVLAGSHGGQPWLTPLTPSRHSPRSTPGAASSTAEKTTGASGFSARAGRGLSSWSGYVTRHPQLTEGKRCERIGRSPKRHPREGPRGPSPEGALPNDVVRPREARYLR